MKYPVPLDPSTGLAQLPEGFFWRVSPPPWWGNYFHLELRRVTFYGSKNVHEHPLTKLASELTAKEIMETSTYLVYHESDVQLILGRVVEEQRDRTNHPLLGDYPPKSVL